MDELRLGVVEDPADAGSLQQRCGAQPAINVRP
jgi:hypothetical protein